MNINILKIITPLFVFLTIAISCSDNFDDFQSHQEFIEIPDSNFEAFLIENQMDSDGLINQSISKEDAAQITELDFSNSNFDDITDLTGIEGFVNLRTLNATRHEINRIDLSKNLMLEVLNLEANNLSDIDLSKNNNLKEVDISFNDLTSIYGVDQLNNLKSLNLSGNLFENIIIDNHSLEILLATDNRLKTINISNAPALISLLLNRNNIKQIDVRLNRNLETFIISGNELETLDLSNNENLTYFYASSNKLRELDISTNLNLMDLRVHQNASLNCIKIENGQQIQNLVLSNFQVLNTECN